VIGENERRCGLRNVKSLVESAKWNMYAELWTTAQNQLEEARILAVSARDKHMIDEILMLRAKCEDKEKPEINY
jgi:translation initiation factor IF-2